MIIVALYVCMRLITQAIRQFPRAEKVLPVRIIVAAACAVAFALTAALTYDTLCTAVDITTRQPWHPYAP